MAKVIAPFKIVGTLDDLNFYVDQNNENIVRRKGKAGVTSEEFRRNPRFRQGKKPWKRIWSRGKKSADF